MKENIFTGHYNDPFDRDPLTEENIDNYAKEVEEISTNDKLKESYNKYFRKRREGVENLEDDENFKYQHNPKRHMRKVNIGTEPWNYDQSFIWPDYEAESFENDLEQFRKRPESNTGYLNKKLNQIMQTRWGKEQANKCIDNTLFKGRIKKESIQKRFLKSLKENHLKELVGSEGTWGIEVDIAANTKNAIMDFEGGFRPGEEAFQKDTKKEVLDSPQYNKAVKKYGQKNVRIIRF